MVTPAQPRRSRLTVARRALLGAAFSLVLSGFTGCVRYVETYSVTFRGRNGSEIASGEINLTSPLPKTGGIRAHYTLKFRPVSAPDRDMQAFFQAFKGNESGRVDWEVGTAGGEPSKVDFIPSATEFDVVVTAVQQARGYWSGRWKYNNLTGTYEGGSAYISRKAETAPRN